MSLIKTSIVNQKGGVGKTTTAINLAAALHLNHNKKVLLVDLDPQGNSSVVMGHEAETFKHSVYDILIENKSIKDVIKKTRFEGIDLVPADARLQKAEEQLLSKRYRETILSKSLKNLKGYDHVIFDCRPTLGELTCNAIYASTSIIIPIQMSRFALDGFDALLKTIDEIKQDENMENAIRIMLTLYNSSKSIINNWAGEQLAPFSDIIFKTKIRQNEAINQAHVVQEPVQVFSKTSHGANDYCKLGKEFIKWVH